MVHIHQQEDEVVIDVQQDYRKRRITVKTKTAIILMVLSLAMLTLMQEPIGWSFLSWLALAPWVVAVVGIPGSKKFLLTVYLTGVVYFLVNLYWLSWVTFPGWIAVCFYLAVYFVVSGFILRRVYTKYRWPFTLVLPVVWVAQEYLRATVMTGFPWFFLAHAQHDSPALIQLCDLTGAYGLTFIIALVNGLLCDLLLRPLKQPADGPPAAILTTRVLVLLVACMIGGTVLYGRYRLRQGAETITPGPVITVVQEVIPIHVKEEGSSSEEIFARHLAISEQALAAKDQPDLIVWPETMVGGYMNTWFLRQRIDDEFWQDISRESRAFDDQLRTITAKGPGVLVGAASIEIDFQTGDNLRYNSAMFYQPGGARYADRYDKMHLVPFGEVVPFKRSWPWLYNTLNHLTPYDYDYSLEAGTETTVFPLEYGDRQKSNFAVAICYEDVTPHMPRKLAALKKDGTKQADFLLNISNDGWFVSGGKDSPVRPSSELMQHWIIGKFRAVENRVGIARAVNTGISGFIRPDGREQSNSLSSTLPENPRDRQGQNAAGYITDHIYIDSRTTLYAKIGDTFALICTLITTAILLATLKKRKNT